MEQSCRSVELGSLGERETPSAYPKICPRSLVLPPRRGMGFWDRHQDGQCGKVEPPRAVVRLAERQEHRIGKFRI
jgi:hypothetical protein